LNVSRDTVYTYLTFLEQTYFIALLARHSGSIDRQAAGSKKVFFCDSGVAQILGQLSQGQLFEQSVFQNLRPAHALSFYNKRGGAEIDFIIDSKLALEVKNTASTEDVATLIHRANALSLTEKYVAVLEYSTKKETILATDI